MTDEPHPIDGAEAKQHLEYVQRWLSTEDVAERKSVLGNALVWFGMRFVHSVTYMRSIAPDHLRTEMEALFNDSVEVFSDWLMGARLSDRVDEAERRSLTAIDALNNGGTGLARLAARALLQLPEGHKLRDSRMISANLEKRAAEAGHSGDWESCLLTWCELLNQSLIDEPAGERVIGEILAIISPENQETRELSVSDRCRALRIVMLWHVTWVVDAREKGLDTAGPHLDAARSLVEQVREIGGSAQDRLAIGFALEEAGDSEAAADIMSELVDERSDIFRTAAWIEGMIRLRLGQTKRATEVLELILPDEEQEYLLAVSDEDVADKGSRFSKDGVNLAFSYAAEGCWVEALGTMERVKSARMRHAALLRNSDAGRELLTIEAKLTSVRRGVPGSDQSARAVDLDKDPLGARVSGMARLLEEYRAKRPELATIHLDPPSVADVADALEPGEAVISLGSGFKGLLALMIVSGDRDIPSGRHLIEELPSAKVAALFFSSDTFSGWALELAARSPVDPEPALTSLVNAVDAALGERLAAMLATKNIDKVTIIAHRMLHLVPFWILPSLAKLEVRMAPSLAQWYQSRQRVVKVAPKLTAVGNPTLDLALAKVEASAAAKTMSARGWDVRLLTGAEAEEDAIRDALDGAGFFHFAGHGLSRPMQPLSSSLLAHPSKQWGWPIAGDPLAHAADGVDSWSSPGEGIRHADTDQGRLIEYLDEEEMVVERQLEYSERGSLWGSYDTGQLVQLAELWTTADILVEEAFEDCGVAFLGACESGQSALRTDVDEAVGLPSALRIAGIGTVICTLWPVGDVAALLFAQLFYRRLAQEGAGVVDIAAIVRSCRSELAQLPRAEAGGLLETLAAQVADRRSKAELDHAIAELAGDEDLPFAHPYHWAAFFTVGCERVELTAP